MKEQQVLVIDDSLEDFEAIKWAFRKITPNLQITHCSNSEGVIGTIREQKYNPALILLDLNMPGKDGRTLLVDIKSDQALNHIPVIILSTSGTNPDIQFCYKNGANSYMQKPFDLDHLVHNVRNLANYWFDTAILPTGEKENARTT